MKRRRGGEAERAVLVQERRIVRCDYLFGAMFRVCVLSFPVNPAVFSRQGTPTSSAGAVPAPR